MLMQLMILNNEFWKAKLIVIDFIIIIEWIYGYECVCIIYVTKH